MSRPQKPRATNGAVGPQARVARLKHGLATRREDAPTAPSNDFIERTGS